MASNDAVKVRDILQHEAVQRRIEAGDITQADVDTLKKSYNAITICTGLGLLSGVPLWFAVARKGYPLYTRMLVAGMTTIGGGFLGTSVGGVFAALEVKKNMPDSERKLKVFQEIAFDIQRAMVERRAGMKPGTVISHQAGVPAPDQTWNPDQGPPGSVASDGAPSAVGQAIQQSGGNAWDRLRHPEQKTAADAPAPRRVGTPAGGVSADASPEDEYARRQREFDAMLERERKGGNDNTKW